MIQIRKRHPNTAVSTAGPDAAPEPTRRRVLAAGATMAAAGMLAPFRSPVAWADGERSAAGSPRIDRIFPLRGAEGDSVVITGHGFDPEPANNCVVLGEGLARVEVVEAAASHLAGVIGPVAQTWSGPISVALGRGRALPDHAVTHQGVTSVATHIRRFEAVATLTSPVAFELVRRSPFVVEGSLSDGLEIGLGSTSNVGYRSARVDFWSTSGAHLRFELGLAAGESLSPEAYAFHLASHINGLDLGGGISATAAGAALKVAQAGAGRGFGRVRSC